MANKITQVQQYVWYGTCEVDLCEDQIFEEMGTKMVEIDNNVTEVSTYEEGILKTYRPDGKYSSPVKPGEGELDRFKCGSMYSMTLKPNGTLEFDNMYPSNQMSIDKKYGVSTTCSALGDGGLSCIPEGYTAFYYKDALTAELDLDGDNVNEVVKRQLIYMKDVNGTNTICTDLENEVGCKVYASLMWNRGASRDVNSYMAIDLQPLQPFADAGDESPIPLSVNLKLGPENNERVLGFLSFQTNPGPYSIYLYENGTCYSGAFTDITTTGIGAETEYNLKLVQEWSSSTMCTYTDESDNPVVFELFEVDPNTNPQTGDIRPSNFIHEGDVRVPPVGASSDDGNKIVNLYYYTNITEPIGRITYVNSTYEKPGVEASEQTPFVYFFGRTGAFTGKCLFGVIMGEKCILGE